MELLLHLLLHYTTATYVVISCNSSVSHCLRLMSQTVPAHSLPACLRTVEPVTHAQQVAVAVEMELVASQPDMFKKSA